MKNKGKPSVKDRIHPGHAGQGGSGFRAKTKQKARMGITNSVSDVSKPTGVYLQDRCVPANRPCRAPCFSQGSWALLGGDCQFHLLSALGVKDLFCDSQPGDGPQLGKCFMC